MTVLSTIFSFTIFICIVIYSSKLMTKMRCLSNDQKDFVKEMTISFHNDDLKITPWLSCSRSMIYSKRENSNEHILYENLKKRIQIEINESEL